MLKIPRERLIKARLTSTNPRESLNPLVKSQRASNKSPKTMLVSGPTMATTNSVSGWRASSAKWETPPNINSVIPVTGIPLRTATTLWESSWASTDTKNSTVVSMAINQRWSTGTESVGKAVNCRNIKNTNRRNTKIQL